MSGNRVFDFDYGSDNDSTAVHTPLGYNPVFPSEVRRPSTTDNNDFVGAQVTPRNSAEIAREGYAALSDGNASTTRHSDPSDHVEAPVRRPRPVLRGAGSPDDHGPSERTQRGKGVRFGSHEKGDGKQPTPDRFSEPLSPGDLETINEKLSYDTESDDENPKQRDQSEMEANRLVRQFTRRNAHSTDPDTDLESGRSTPKHGSRDGLLSLLLRLNNRSDCHSGASTPVTPATTPPQSLPTSGYSTPLNFFSSHRSHSTNSLSALLSSSSKIALPTTQADLARDFNKKVNEKLSAWEKEQKSQRKKENRNSGTLNTFRRLARKKDKHDKVRTLIAETIDKQQYVVKLCRALIRYGAPTHRLEAYMRTSADSLGIGGQFLYIPGCMIISFDDENTHTAEVKLVRENQGVDLGRMDSCHNIYKQVANGTLLVREGHMLLTELMRRKPPYSRPFLVFMYGLAAASVGPFAFQARLIDLPIAFLLGCIVGLLQYYVNAQSELWASCFTILAPLITSALARVFGSIRGGNLFCFSALAQSSIALILPGYTVLCSALELQSGSMVAGSIRLVYAIIYSLFLGFGITIGTAIVGAVWKDATSATTCSAPIADYWYFFSVPLFTLCLTIINQAKWKQAPVQMIISIAGYQVNFWVSQYVKGQSVANAAGACAVGLLANMYARFGYHHEQRVFDWCRRHVKPHLVKFIPNQLKQKQDGPPVIYYDGSDTPIDSSTEGTIPLRSSSRHRVTYGLAAAAMLPAIWVQVPSGLAVGGSLISGITSADQITGNSTGISVQSSASENGQVNTAVLTVAFSVVQIAVAITVGLFISTVMVYPRGKKGGGVFTM